MCDSTLRHELRRLVREKPNSNLYDLRDEAMMWTHSTNVLRKIKLVSGGVDEISDKIDSISCSAFSELTMQNAISEGSSKGGRAKIQPEYTSDGQPICL